MTDLSEKPLYRLIQPFYVDDILIEAETPGRNGMEPTVIEFEGIPNEAMEPLNGSARENMGKFLATLAAGNRAAGRSGDRTPPVGDIVYNAVAERPRESPTLVQNVPPMSGLIIDNPQKFRQAPEREPTVKVVEATETVGIRPRKVMGTIVREESILSGQGA